MVATGGFNEVSQHAQAAPDRVHSCRADHLFKYAVGLVQTSKEGILLLLKPYGLVGRAGTVQQKRITHTGPTPLSGRRQAARRQASNKEGTLDTIGTSIISFSSSPLLFSSVLFSIHNH